MDQAQQTQCWIDESGTVACASPSTGPSADAPLALTPAEAPIRIAAPTGDQVADVHGAEIEAPYVPPCCVELGEFQDGGVAYNGRLVCEDPTDAANGKLVSVEVSTDATEAKLSITVGDQVFDYLLPVCVIERPQVEVPCCVRAGRLWCPDAPDYHGMAVDAFRRLTSGELLSCPEMPPPLAMDCCVQLGERGALVLCADPSSPLHGYELREDEYTCLEQGGQTVCEIWISVPAPAGVVCFDTSTGRVVNGSHDGAIPSSASVVSTPDGPAVDVVLGDGQMRVPACSTRHRARVPVCEPPPPPPVPADCCYDLGRGTLLCPSQADGPWNGLRVALIDLVEVDGSVRAVVGHGEFGERPVTLPLCEVVVEGCCYDAASMRLVCPSSQVLDGLEATMLALRESPAGQLAHVVWAGGSASVPFCSPPRSRPHPFCCVNLDTSKLVCPGDPQRNGASVEVAATSSERGQVYARMHDGTVLPACGMSCPAPCPCPEPPECVACPECTPAFVRAGDSAPTFDRTCADCGPGVQ